MAVMNIFLGRGEKVTNVSILRVTLIKAKLSRTKGEMVNKSKKPRILSQR